MEERPERAQRDEELRRQEHHGKGREQGDLAVRELNERHDDAHRRAAEREQVHDRDRVQLHAQKPHRRTAKRLGLLVHARMALPVGLVDLERGQTLQVLEERAAQVGVGAPVGAHDALGDLLHRHDGQGDERHARQEGRRRGQAQGREAREQREGGQNRVEQLRDVLAEVALQRARSPPRSPARPRQWAPARRRRARGARACRTPPGAPRAWRPAPRPARNAARPPSTPCAPRWRPPPRIPGPKATGPRRARLRTTPARTGRTKS